MTIRQENITKCVSVTFCLHQDKVFHVQFDFLPNLSQLLQPNKIINLFFFFWLAVLTELTEIYELYSPNSANFFLHLIWIYYLLKNQSQHTSLLGSDEIIFCLEFGLIIAFCVETEKWNTKKCNYFPKF